MSRTTNTGPQQMQTPDPPPVVYDWDSTTELSDQLQPLQGRSLRFERTLQFALSVGGRVEIAFEG